VRQIAEGFAVAGHAANLADGRVEVLLQGEKEEVEGMEKEIGQSHLEGFIRKQEGQEVAVESGRRGFQIR
jgi:acylphosphatase